MKAGHFLTTGLRLSYARRKELLANNEARLFANLTRSKMRTCYRFDDVGGPEQFNLGTILLARTFALGSATTSTERPAEGSAFSPPSAPGGHSASG